MNNSACTVQIDGLDKMIKALKEQPLPVAKIGILGNSSSRDGGQSNAEIGVAHEFGNERVPQRSFLRIPLSDYLNEKLQEANAFTEAVLKEVVKQKTIRPWLEKAVAVGVGIVLEAFETGGFGKWAPWKNPNERQRNSNAGMLLVDTTQLRDSISGEVK